MYVLEQCAYLKAVLSAGSLQNSDSFFVVADSHLANMYKVNVSTRATTQLLSTGVASNPIAVAYDPTSKSMYWTDIIHHTIFKYSLTTNYNTVVYTDPFNTGKIGLFIYDQDAAHSSQRLYEIICK